MTVDAWIDRLSDLADLMESPHAYMIYVGKDFTKADAVHELRAIVRNLEAIRETMRFGDATRKPD